MRRISVFALVMLAGCGAKTPPLSSESKAMVSRFEEHLPRHKTQTFEGLCKDVEKMHDTKKISDLEYDALHKVCGPASTGQWDRAKVALDNLVKSVDEKK